MAYDVINVSSDVLPAAPFTRLLVPDNYVDRAVCYHHGYGEDHIDDTSDKAAIIEQLTDEGYLIISCAAPKWGSDAAMSQYVAAMGYVRDNYAPTGVVCWSQSMGGISGLLHATSGFPELVGWCGIYPVCSLAAAWDGGTHPVFAGDIRSAYSIDPDSEYDTATAGHDPLLIDPSSYVGFPMRFWSSPSDTLVPEADHTHALRTHLTPRAREYAVVECTGNHGDASHFQPSDVSAFLARAFTVASGRFSSVFSGVVR